MSESGRGRSLPRDLSLVEEAVLVLARGGDEWALEHLMAVLSPCLVRLAESILVCDGDRASDVVQETWLSASQRLKMFESVDHLARWTYTVCRRAAISILRRERRRVTVAWCDSPGEPGFVPSPPSPLVEAGDPEAGNRVRAAIARLPDTQRGVATLHYIHGQSIGEVAHILRTRVATVKMRLHRARHRLRRLLRDCAPS